MNNYKITKLMRPFGILLVVLLWPNFVSIIEQPIRVMEGTTKTTALNNIARVSQLSEQRHDLSERLFQRMIAEATSIELKTEEINKPGGTYDVIVQTGVDILSGQAFRDFTERFENMLTGVYGLISAKIKYFITWAFTWAYQVLAGVMILLIFYLRVLLSGLLYLIGPFAFALSIFPAFENSWKKWTSRFIGVQLYGLLGYVAVSAGTYLIQSVLEAEVSWYEGILASGLGADITSVYLANNMDSATITYIISLMVFGFSMFSIPIVAGWFTSDASAGTIGTKAIKTATEGFKKIAETSAKAAGKIA